MRFKYAVIPASLAFAAALALPSYAQDPDRGFGDMGRDSPFYDFREPGPDRYYDRYEDRLRDLPRDRRWSEPRRDMSRYRDRGSDRRYGEPYASRDYRDYRDYSAQRDYYDDRYGRDMRGGDDDLRYGRGSPYSQEWLYEDRYADRYDRGDRGWRGTASRRGDYTADRYRDYTADRDDDVDFSEMDIRDRAQWNERTYRGSANRGLHD